MTTLLGVSSSLLFGICPHCKRTTWLGTSPNGKVGHAAKSAISLNVAAHIFKCDEDKGQPLDAKAAGTKE
jgi:hypothetical protein